MNQFDVVIVGAGAAGLSAGQYAARTNLKTVIVDPMGSGGQCMQIESLENYPGFPEAISGEEFIDRFERQARSFGAEFRTTAVTAIEQRNGIFIVHTDGDSIRATTVIVATGAVHRKLGVPGEEELQGCGVSYCATCDGPMFRGKRILVVGGGDAACDEASFLSKLSDDVVMVHRRDRFRAQKALAKRVLENSSIEVRFSTEIEEITSAPNDFGIDAVSSVRLRDNTTGQSYTESFAAVFIFIGSTPYTSFVDFLDLDDAGYIVTDANMETSVPGIYAAGDVRTTPFRQLVVAASDGAIAAHAAGEYIDALGGEAYPTRQL